MALNQKLIDKRILRRSLEKGQVSQEAYDDYLANLPDTSTNAEKVAPEPEAKASEGAESTGG